MCSGNTKYLWRLQQQVGQESSEITPKYIRVDSPVQVRERQQGSPSAAVGRWTEAKEREMFYLTTHSTHFIDGYMASDIWLRTILIVRKETRRRHIGYSYRLTARVLLYSPSHRQDNTCHCLCYTSRGALAGTRNSSMGPPHEGSIRRPIAPWTNALPLSYVPLRSQESPAAPKMTNTSSSSWDWSTSRVPGIGFLLVSLRWSAFGNMPCVNCDWDFE